MFYEIECRRRVRCGADAIAEPPQIDHDHFPDPICILDDENGLGAPGQISDHRRCCRVGWLSRARMNFAGARQVKPNGRAAAYFARDLDVPFRLVDEGLFCHITQTWRGKPLTSRLVVVELISATTTKTGLQVHCELDPRAYPKGIKVSDAEMDTLNIRGNPFHPEWNYTIAPRVPP